MTPEPDRGSPTARDDETLTAGPGSAGARRSDPLAPGARIGRFTVLRKLGEGGMGVVHAAYDDELDRKIAIKLVRAERVDDLARARVLREAQAMARVSHPNVVQIYEVGEHGEQVYVAMEFVAGPTLAGWTAAWRERARVEGQLAWPEILARYVDAGRGLAAAHSAGLVHRDFKPVNAIVGDDGRVRVLDFGIARPIAGGLLRQRPVANESTIGEDAPTNQSTLTQTGALVGTPAYMSLEQFESADVDARSDQFSFCVALWEALHGERPFEGRTPGALILAMREGRLRTPTSTSVPAWLRERIRRGLACEPSNRWPSMDALLDALLDDPELRRRVRRRRMAIGTLALVLFGGSLEFAREQMASAEQAENERTRALEEEAAAQRREAAAQAERDRALADAQASALRARDIARILAARSLTRDPTLAVALLREVENPQAPGWRSAAFEILQRAVSRQVLDVHEDRVVDLEYGRDGKWLASASFDGKVRLWSTAGLRSDTYYELDHGDRVFDVDFDPSGRRLVAGSRNQTARVWTLPDGPPTRAAQPLEPTHVLRGREGILWTTRFSPTGDRVVTASRGGDVRVWPLGEDPEPSSSHRLELGNIVWHAEFSPDGGRIAIAANDGGVRLWELERDQVRELWRHGGVAWVAHFSPDGRWVASASQTGEVRLDRVAPDLEHEGTTLRGHTGPVQRMAFSRDGRALASCSHDGTARLWSLDEAGRPQGASRVFEVGNSFAHSPSFSPDGRWLAIGSVEPTVRVIEVAGGLPIELRGHTSEVFSVRFSPDGKSLASGSFDHDVRIWDTDWSKVERRFMGALWPDDAGRWLIERRDDDRVRLWQITRDSITPRWQTRDPLPGTSRVHARSAAGDWLALPNDQGELLGFELDEQIADDRDLVPRWRVAGVGELVGAHFSAENSWLVAGDVRDQPELRLWHFPEGYAGGPRPIDLDHLPAHESGLAVVGLSVDGRHLISSTIRGDVHISTLDPSTGTVGEPHRYGSPQSGRSNVMVHDPGGAWVAISALDRSVRVWSFDRPDAPTVDVMLASEARSMVYDARNDRLLLGCTDGILRSLDPRTGAVEVIERVTGHLFGIEMAAHQPWLGFGAADGELIVREAVDARIELAIEGGIYRIDFGADDHRLIVSDARGMQRVLHVGEDLDAASLLERLHAVSDYCPSVDERVRYAGESPQSAARGCQPSDQ